MTRLLGCIADDFTGLRTSPGFSRAVACGYETRLLYREDFSNDRVDAGEIRAVRLAFVLGDRERCSETLLELAWADDWVVVMDGRDDTLSSFAAGLVARLGV